MQWFVSNQGTTVGPMSADQLRAGITSGQITAGMHVRDEQGQWVAIEQSPFAGLLPTPLAPAPPVAPTAKSNESGVGATISALLLLGLGIYVFAKCSGSSEAPPAPVKVDDGRSMAWTMSRHFVEKRLKSPGSADYGGVFNGTYQSYDKQCVVLPAKRFRCHGWVDSQNGFGALVRSNWDMTIEDQGENWSLVELHSFE